MDFKVVRLEPEQGFLPAFPDIHILFWTFDHMFFPEIMNCSPFPLQGGPPTHCKWSYDPSQYGYNRSYPFTFGHLWDLLNL